MLLCGGFPGFIYGGGVSNISFGTSGLRGEVKDFSRDVVVRYVHAFLATMRQKYTFDAIDLAIDRRPSSPVIASFCMSAIDDEELGVFYHGIIPTPALAHHSMGGHRPCIMVTGSHIPFEYNGIKFYSPFGEITKSNEAKIVARVESCASSFFKISEKRKCDLSFDAGESYLSRYVSWFGSCFLANKRVGLYQHSAAGRDLTVTVLEAMGADVEVLGRSENFVPVDTEAVS